ncbi:hypothetical protein FQP90_21400 [Paenarthrobacter nitroguajacolicus]|uniref:Uncharacterized protein n=1 Tax=Paenarthrobacter nitroguajacolicus TaxID=211146 RepID=A0A558GN97_PAENT|nr:hypothetical protein [Paenarthrobacter nitroguajacolicus]TVU58352.1 hypothetical protein FQP90_21400 [Paenarthrobacter nitroguajacolicus]
MRKKMKLASKILTATLGCTLALSTLAMAAPSHAAAPTVGEQKSAKLSDTNVQEIKDLLSRFQVPAGQQKELIKKVRHGTPWDVYDSNKVPVAVEHDQVIGDMNYTIKRYADGSVAAQGVERPVTVDPSAPNPMSIFNCSVTTGSGYAAYRNCQVDGVWGTVLLGAYGMDFTIINGALDTISDRGAGFQKCIFPTGCSTPTRVFYQAQEGPGAAHSRWQSDVTHGFTTWNVWVQLNVANNTYWQTNS